MDLSTIRKQFRETKSEGAEQSQLSQVQK